MLYCVLLIRRETNRTSLYASLTVRGVSAIVKNDHNLSFLRRVYLAQRNSYPILCASLILTGSANSLPLDSVNLKHHEHS